MNNNKTYIYVAAGIVVLLLAGWAIYAYNNQSNVVVNNNVTNNPDDNVAATGTTTPTSTPVTSVKLSYGDAIKAYPYRLQFVKCSSNPGTLAVKRGSVVMLDNRDVVKHTFKADNQTFTIAANDYALLKTAALTSAVKVNVTCDGGGSAMLNVQK